MCSVAGNEFVPKSEVLNWLTKLHVLLWEERESGVIDISRIEERVNTIIRNVDDY